MAKKIYLSPSNQNGNKYATGNTNEMEQCNKIAAAAEAALKRCGFSVKRAPKGQEMGKSISESNAWKADLHIPIHTNAFDGRTTGGTMIMVYSNSGENAKAAKAIKAALDPLTPGKDYAIQTRTDLAELRQTTAIAVYCECEFHDTKEGASFIIANSKGCMRLLRREIHSTRKRGSKSEVLRPDWRVCRKKERGSTGKSGKSKRL